MKIGIHARVSTTDQDCAQQLAELRHYVAARGWTVKEEYVDHAYSRVKDSRPAMNRLRTAARTRRVDAIVVWKIDRWGPVNASVRLPRCRNSAISASALSR